MLIHNLGAFNETCQASGHGQPTCAIDKDHGVIVTEGWTSRDADVDVGAVNLAGCFNGFLDFDHLFLRLIAAMDELLGARVTVSSGS